MANQLVEDEFKMEFSCEVRGSTLVTRIKGELDLNTADELRNKLDTALKNSAARNLICDFSGVSFIDSSGLGVLIGRLKNLETLGGSITIKNPRPSVYRILELSGLNKVMTIEKSQQSYKEESR